MAIAFDLRQIRRFEAWLGFVLKAERIGRFVVYTLKRFGQDGCPRQAAGLGYISLLSIVPLLAIGLGILAAFPAFEDIRNDIQLLIFTNFLPKAGQAMGNQLTFFVENASKATGPGVLAFGLTAVLLLNNITSALDAIWRVPEPRPIAMRMLVYWTLLTLGPLLLGSSMSLSSYAFAVVEWSGVGAYTPSFVPFARVISIVLAALGFALIYFVVPNRTVRLSHALTGGFVAAILFEVLKAGFGLYLRGFGSYQAIYGALSALPTFLMWMYLSWAVVLLGAEVAAALPEWRASHARGRVVAGPGERLALALSLLQRLRDMSRSGGPMKERKLVVGLPATPTEIDAILLGLRRAGIVARSAGAKWVLSRDLSTITLGDLAKELTLDLDPGEGWPEAASQAVSGLVEAGGVQLDRSVGELLERA